jgi:hypothetical protein
MIMMMMMPAMIMPAVDNPKIKNKPKPNTKTKTKQHNQPSTKPKNIFLHLFSHFKRPLCVMRKGLKIICYLYL